MSEVRDLVAIVRYDGVTVGYGVQNEKATTDVELSGEKSPRLSYGTVPIWS